jgi:hypothetical protein
MRFIPKQKIERNIPQKWLKKAQKLTERMINLSTEQRKKVIKEKELWKELKGILKKVMNGKCWYCESNQCRTDNPIDHFRPKNRVAESTLHQGYWWLAYKWQNYRYCCDYCNTHGSELTRGTPGGKQDHFPLWDESQRSNSITDNLELEQPLLLDPLCRTDPGLLWFNEDGSAVPHICCGNDSEQYLFKRASESIRLYHLNQTEIKEKRALLWNDIKKLVENADKMFLKFSNGNQTARDAFEHNLDLLSSKIDENAEYSMTALAMLMGLRGKSAAAEAVLETR